MSLAEQQVRIFIHLIKTQPELFSEYTEELIQLIDETPDDIESLYNKIMVWCRKPKQIQINQAFAKLSEEATKEKSVGDEELIEEIPDNPSYKQLLKNTIQQSFTD